MRVVVQRCLGSWVLRPSKHHLLRWLHVLPAIHRHPSARLHLRLHKHHLLHVLPWRGLLHILQPPLHHLRHVVSPAAAVVVLHWLHHPISSGSAVARLWVRRCLGMCLQRWAHGRRLVVLEGLRLLLRRREAHRGGVRLVHAGRRRQRRLYRSRRRRGLPRLAR